MDKFDVTLAGSKYTDVEIGKVGTFNDGSPVYELHNEESTWEGPVARINSRLPLPAAEGCFWIKDYAENEGLEEQLLELGLIELTGRSMPSGYVSFNEARWTAKAGL